MIYEQADGQNRCYGWIQYTGGKNETLGQY